MSLYSVRQSVHKIFTIKSTNFDVYLYTSQLNSDLIKFKEVSLETDNHGNAFTTVQGQNRALFALCAENKGYYIGYIFVNDYGMYYARIFDSITFAPVTTRMTVKFIVAYI